MAAPNMNDMGPFFARNRVEHDNHGGVYRTLTGGKKRRVGASSRSMSRRTAENLCVEEVIVSAVTSYPVVRDCQCGVAGGSLATINLEVYGVDQNVPGCRQQSSGRMDSAMANVIVYWRFTRTVVRKEVGASWSLSERLDHNPRSAHIWRFRTSVGALLRCPSDMSFWDGHMNLCDVVANCQGRGRLIHEEFLPHTDCNLRNISPLVPTRILCRGRKQWKQWEPSRPDLGDYIAHFL